MPLVGFRGALRFGDRGSVPQGRSGDGGAVLGSPQPGLAARSPKTPWSGSMSLPTRSDFQTAMKGDRLRPLRSAQAVAVHQDGIGGRGHPVERCRFFPDQAKFGAVRRRHGLRPRRSGRCPKTERAPRPVPSFRRHKRGDNQIDRTRVLEVRIQSPPADSQSLPGFLLPVSKSRQLPRRARARPAGTVGRDA